MAEELYRSIFLNSSDKARLKQALRNLGEKRRQVLTTQDSLGNLPTHIAVDKQSRSALKRIIKCLNECDRFSMLKIRNDIGNTVLDEAIIAGRLDLCRVIMENLSYENRSALLELQNKRGWTALHRVAMVTGRQANRRDICRHLLESVSLHQRQSLAQITDATGLTILHKAACLRDDEIFKCIFESFERADRIPLLEMQDDTGNPVSHVLAIKGRIDTLEWIVERIEDTSLRRRIFKINDSNGRTLLHIAAESWNGTQVRRLLVLLPGEGNFESFWNQDKLGQTPLHYAAGRSDSVIKYLLAAIPRNTRFAILERQNCMGNTALHKAARINPHNYGLIVDSVDSPAQKRLLSIRNSNQETPSRSTHSGTGTLLVSRSVPNMTSWNVLIPDQTHYRHSSPPPPYSMHTKQSDMRMTYRSLSVTEAPNSLPTENYSQTLPSCTRKEDTINSLFSIESSTISYNQKETQARTLSNSPTSDQMICLSVSDQEDPLNSPDDQLTKRQTYTQMSTTPSSASQMQSHTHQNLDTSASDRNIQSADIPDQKKEGDNSVPNPLVGPEAQHNLTCLKEKSPDTLEEPETRLNDDPSHNLNTSTSDRSTQSIDIPDQEKEGNNSVPNPLVGPEDQHMLTCLKENSPDTLEEPETRHNDDTPQNLDTLASDRNIQSTDIPDQKKGGDNSVPNPLVGPEDQHNLTCLKGNSPDTLEEPGTRLNDDTPQNLDTSASDRNIQSTDIPDQKKGGDNSVPNPLVGPEAQHNLTCLKEKSPDALEEPETRLNDDPSHNLNTSTSDRSTQSLDIPDQEKEGNNSVPNPLVGPEDQHMLTCLKENSPDTLEEPETRHNYDTPQNLDTSASDRNIQSTDIPDQKKGGDNSVPNPLVGPEDQHNLTCLKGNSPIH